jgi:hypothetical protein
MPAWETGPTVLNLATARNRTLVRHRCELQLIPARRTSPMIHRIPSPRGGQPEACRLAGWVRRLRARVAPRSREASGTDLGVLRPLREELARCAGSHWRERSAARSFQIAVWRSATGRADGGSIHPRRILAQWMRTDTHAPRGAPLPLTSKRPRAGTRAGKTRGREPFSPRGRRWLGEALTDEGRTAHPVTPPSSPAGPSPPREKEARPHSHFFQRKNR